MALQFGNTNIIEATSDEAKILLGRLDKTIDGIIGELVKEETDLHDFVGDFEDEANKKEFLDIIFGDTGVVGVMNRTFETLVYWNKLNMDEKQNEIALRKETEDALRAITEKKDAGT